MKICIKCEYLKENDEFKNSNICSDCINGIPYKKVMIEPFYYNIICECGVLLFPMGYRSHIKSLRHKNKIKNLI